MSIYMAKFGPVLKERISFFIDPQLLVALEALRERDGVPVAESIRRAIAAYIESKGLPEASRARARSAKKGTR
jgi:hypothetical protein